jgi:hypothetical protein
LEHRGEGGFERGLEGEALFLVCGRRAGVSLGFEGRRERER